MGKDAQSAFDVLNEIENENMDSHQVELEEPQNIDDIDPFMSYIDLLNIGNTSESGSSTKKRKRRKNNDDDYVSALKDMAASLENGLLKATDKLG